MRRFVDAPVSAERPRSPATEESADEVRAEPDALRNETNHALAAPLRRREPPSQPLNFIRLFDGRLILGMR